MSLGNYLGGRLADRYASLRLLGECSRWGESPPSESWLPIHLRSLPVWSGLSSPRFSYSSPCYFASGGGPGDDLADRR